MAKGPNRIILDQYLDSASDGWVLTAGSDWKKKADDLQTLAEGLQQAAAQVELRIGEQTLTGPALRKSMEESSVSLTTKADQLRAAGEALRQVGQQISDTKDSRDNMADLGPKPSPYQAPANTTGVEPTPEEIAAQAAASQARQAERSAWQSAYEKQEARSLALTKQMDAAFLAAILPMKEIHGQPDPTEPPPSSPSAPSSGPYLPGTQAPPVTGGGAGGGGGRGVAHMVGTELVQVGNQNHNPNHTEINQPPTKVTPPATTTPTVPTTLPTHVPTEVPSTSVGGTSQSGVAYQSPGAGISAPTTSGGSAGVSAAALGAAGAAGGASAMTGGVRPGPLTSTGGSQVRPIGSTGRAGATGALSRAATAGSPTTAARSAGAAGSTASRAGAAGSTAGRGAAGGRGASGSRAAGTAGAAGAAGRRGRKGARDRATDRDRLVYDQDWLGDDDVAPGVLD